MHAYIAGQVPMSTIHWQGKVAFAILFAGNNFRHAFSHAAFAEFKNEYLLETRELKKALEQHRHAVEGVAFAGGEPCLQKPALLELAQAAKRYQLPAVLLTNGTKPDVITALVQEQLISHIILRMPAPLDEAIFDKITRAATFFIPASQLIADIRSTIREVQLHNIPAEVQTTIVPGILYRKEDILNIAAAIAPLRCRWVLKQFVPDPNLLDKKLGNISPPTMKFLETLKEAVQKEYPQIAVELEENSILY
ncbi:4Fe-4S cluster-binding domain-containing protein [Candidatus Woesearchaeota archaeon]|nr:4Fe-4S cluster-binding domain-containing protein [Candidatus Woesearchaeota archaeon]